MTPPRDIAMRPLVHVTDVEVVGDLRLRLTFSDGCIKTVDFFDRAGRGVFAALVDPGEFARVGVDPELGTICWPNGADYDPDLLRYDLPIARA